MIAVGAALAPFIQMLPLESILLRLLWAAVLGAAVGLEREVHGRPTGLRTGVCVAVGSAFFTILSVEIAHATGDTSTTRIASNIVQGIGFLGAGAILRERGSVSGLTSAASIFAVAATGMGAGAGMFWASGFACLLILFALVVLFYVESYFNLKPRYMLFRISTDNTVDMVSEVHQIFSDVGIALDNFQVAMTGPNHLIQFDANITHRKQQKVFQALARPGLTCEMLPVEKSQD